MSNHLGSVGHILENTFKELFAPAPTSEHEEAKDSADNAETKDSAEGNVTPDTGETIEAEAPAEASDAEASDIDKPEEVEAPKSEGRPARPTAEMRAAERLAEIERVKAAKLADAEQLEQYLAAAKVTAAEHDASEEAALRKRNLVVNSEVPLGASALHAPAKELASMGSAGDGLVVVRDMMHEYEVDMLKKTGNYFHAGNPDALAETAQAPSFESMAEDPHYYQNTHSLQQRTRAIKDRYGKSIAKVTKRRTDRLRRTLKASATEQLGHDTIAALNALEEGDYEDDKKVAEAAGQFYKEHRAKAQRTPRLTNEQEDENHAVLERVNHKLNFMRNPRHVKKGMVQPGKGKVVDTALSITARPPGKLTAKERIAGAHGSAGSTEGPASATNTSVGPALSSAEDDQSVAYTSTGKRLKTRWRPKGEDTFSIKPSILSFTDYEMDKEYSQTLTLTNQTALSRGLRLLPPKTPYFSMTLPQFPSATPQIAPGMSVKLRVKFRPNSLSDFNDHITVVTEFGKLQIQLRAWREPPRLTLPLTVDVGACLEGDAIKTEVPFRNEGGHGRFRVFPEADWPCLNLQPGAYSVINVGPFTVSPTEFTLGPQAEDRVTVHFSSNVQGKFEERVVMVCDNGDVTTYTLMGSSTKLAVGLTKVNEQKLTMSAVVPFRHGRAVELDMEQTFTQQQQSLDRVVTCLNSFHMSGNPDAAAEVVETAQRIETQAVEVRRAWNNVEHRMAAEPEDSPNHAGATGTITRGRSVRFKGLPADALLDDDSEKPRCGISQVAPAKRMPTGKATDNIPPRIRFDSVAPGRRARRTFTVTNAGTLPLLFNWNIQPWTPLEEYCKRLDASLTPSVPATRRRPPSTRFNSARKVTTPGQKGRRRPPLAASGPSSPDSVRGISGGNAGETSGGGPTSAFQSEQAVLSKLGPAFSIEPAAGVLELGDTTFTVTFEPHAAAEFSVACDLVIHEVPVDPTDLSTQSAAELSTHFSAKSKSSAARGTARDNIPSSATSVDGHAEPDTASGRNTRSSSRTVLAKPHLSAILEGPSHMSQSVAQHQPSTTSVDKMESLELDMRPNDPTQTTPAADSVDPTAQSLSPTVVKHTVRALRMFAQGSGLPTVASLSPASMVVSGTVAPSAAIQRQMYVVNDSSTPVLFRIGDPQHEAVPPAWATGMSSVLQFFQQLAPPAQHASGSGTGVVPTLQLGGGMPLAPSMPAGQFTAEDAAAAGMYDADVTVVPDHGVVLPGQRVACTVTFRSEQCVLHRIRIPVSCLPVASSGLIPMPVDDVLPPVQQLMQALDGEDTMYAAACLPVEGKSLALASTMEVAEAVAEAAAVMPIPEHVPLASHRSAEHDEAAARASKPLRIPGLQSLSATFEAGVQPPDIRLTQPEVDFGLIGVFESRERTFSFCNVSNTPARWRCTQVHPSEFEAPTPSAAAEAVQSRSRPATARPESMASLHTASQASLQSNNGAAADAKPARKSVQLAFADNTKPEAHDQSPTAAFKGGETPSAGESAAATAVSKCELVCSPADGVLEPGQTVTVTLRCQAGELSTRMKEMMCVEVEGGAKRRLRVRGEIQSPQVYLDLQELDIGTAFIGVPLTRVVKLSNLSNLQAAITWDGFVGRKPENTTGSISDGRSVARSAAPTAVTSASTKLSGYMASANTPPLYDIAFSPPELTLAERETRTVSITITPIAAGQLKAMLSADVRGMPHALGISLNGVIKPLLVSYSTRMLYQEEAERHHIEHKLDPFAARLARKRLREHGEKIDRALERACKAAKRAAEVAHGLAQGTLNAADVMVPGEPDAAAVAARAASDAAVTCGAQVGLMPPLSFGDDVEVYTRRKVRVKIHNLTGIPSRWSAWVKSFPSGSVSPNEAEQTAQQQMQTLQLSPTSKGAKSTSIALKPTHGRSRSTSRVKSVTGSRKGTHRSHRFAQPPPARPAVFLSNEHEEKHKFDSEAGEAMLRQREATKEMEAMLIARRGVAFLVEPACGTLEPYSCAEITVTCCADMPGSYRDEMVIEYDAPGGMQQPEAELEAESNLSTAAPGLRSNQPSTASLGSSNSQRHALPIKLTVGGELLQFDPSTVGLQLLRNPKVFAFGNVPDGSAPLERKIKLLNTSPMDAHVTWKIEPFRMSDPPVVDFSIMPSKDKGGMVDCTLVAHRDDAVEPPFSILTPSITVPARGGGELTVKGVPHSLSDEERNAVIAAGGDPDEPRRAVLSSHIVWVPAGTKGQDLTDRLAFARTKMESAEGMTAMSLAAARLRSKRLVPYGQVDSPAAAFAGEASAAAVVEEVEEDTDETAKATPDVEEAKDESTEQSDAAAADEKAPDSALAEDAAEAGASAEGEEDQTPSDKPAKTTTADAAPSDDESDTPEDDAMATPEGQISAAESLLTTVSVLAKKQSKSTASLPPAASAADLTKISASSPADPHARARAFDDVQISYHDLACDLTISPMRPQLHVDKKESLGGLPFVKFGVWDTHTPDHPSFRRQIPLTNRLAAPLTFTLTVEGPFRVLSCKTNAPKHPLAPGPADSRARPWSGNATRMFTLPQHSNVLCDLVYDPSAGAGGLDTVSLATALFSEKRPAAAAAGPSSEPGSKFGALSSTLAGGNRSALPGSKSVLAQTRTQLKREAIGRILITFANGDTQEVGLRAEVLRPALIAEPALFDFGPLHVEAGAPTVLNVSNPTAVDAEWSLQHIPAAPPKQKVAMDIDALGLRDALSAVQGFVKEQEAAAAPHGSATKPVDDPRVFRFEISDGLISGPTAPPELVKVAGLRQTEAGKQKAPLQLKVWFEPKADVHYECRFRLNVRRGDAFEVVLRGKGSYDEANDRKAPKAFPN